MDERTATTDTWIDTDGSESIRQFATPRYYRNANAGPWAPIDSSLHDSGDGRWTSGANEFTASFGASGVALETVVLGGHGVTFTPVGAAVGVQPMV